MPLLLIYLWPSFHFQVQRSLNNHWQYHRRIASREKKQPVKDQLKDAPAILTQQHFVVDKSKTVVSEEEDSEVSPIAVSLDKTSYLGSLAHGLAVLIDFIISTMIAVIVDYGIGWYPKGVWFAVMYYLTKDIMFRGRSIGKRLAPCYVVEKNSLRTPPWWKHLIRISISFALFLFEFPVRVFTSGTKAFLFFAAGYWRDGWLAVFRAFSFQWGSELAGVVFLSEVEYNSLIYEAEECAPEEIAEETIKKTTTLGTTRRNWIRPVAIIALLMIIVFLSRNMFQRKPEKSTTDQGKSVEKLRVVVYPSTGIQTQASSQLVDAQTVKYGSSYYSPTNTVDGDLSTAWSEGVEGDGIGQFIRYGFDKQIMLKGIKIVGGYNKTAQIFSANNRLKKIRLTFDDGSSADFTLKDSPEWQYVDFPKAIKTSNLTLTILEVYPGVKYKDTAFSDIQFLYEEKEGGETQSPPPIKSSSSSGISSVTKPYLMPETSQRMISVSELVNKSAWELSLIRNEIYARHGRPFQTKEIREYFESQSWYRADPNFSNSRLSEIEQRNVETILSYEKQMGYR